MKQDIKTNRLQERQDYVPASVKVIETSVQRVICTSGDGLNSWNEQLEDGGNIFGTN